MAKENSLISIKSEIKNAMEPVTVKVEVERLDSNTIDEHIRASAAVLQDILAECRTSDGIVCGQCNKSYKSEKTLQAHCLLKHPPNEHEARCLKCNKAYPSMLSLQKHTRYKHLYEHRCNGCYRTFETRPQLMKHANICAARDSPCGVCNKMFTSQLALRNHVNYNHLDGCQHRCEVCRRAFTSRRGLNNHLNVIHPPSESTCDVCCKSFPSRPALKSHILYRHSEGYRCSHCYKVFTSPQRLDRHVSVLHATAFQETKYCGLCKHSFKNSNTLINHIVTRHYQQDDGAASAQV